MAEKTVQLREKKGENEFDDIFPIMRLDESAKEQLYSGIRLNSNRFLLGNETQLNPIVFTCAPYRETNLILYVPQIHSFDNINDQLCILLVCEDNFYIENKIIIVNNSQELPFDVILYNPTYTIYPSMFTIEPNKRAVLSIIFTLDADMVNISGITKMA